jgi:hypothetical protein
MTFYSYFYYAQYLDTEQTVKHCFYCYSDCLPHCPPPHRRYNATCCDEIGDEDDLGSLFDETSPEGVRTSPHLICERS